MCLGQIDCYCADGDAEARAEQAAAAEEEGTVSAQVVLHSSAGARDRWQALGHQMGPSQVWGPLTYRAHCERCGRHMEHSIEVGVVYAGPALDEACGADVAAREADRVAREERHAHDDERRGRRRGYG